MKSKNNKIIIFALTLFIIAGIIIVALKGFNVSLSLRAHDTLKFIFDQKFEQSDVDGICKEVFGDKEYNIKTVEVFTDAVYIISPTITNDEKTSLLEKLDNLYKVEEDVTDGTATETDTTEDETEETTLIEGLDYDFYSDSKVRIRDIVKPYVVPTLISALIIIVYIAIKYAKLNNGKVLVTVLKTIGEMVVILLTLLSIIAMTRIPFQSSIIPILMFIMLVCLVVKLACYEKQLKEIEDK